MRVRNSFSQYCHWLELRRRRRHGLPLGPLVRDLDMEPAVPAARVADTGRRKRDVEC